MCMALQFACGRSPELNSEATDTIFHPVMLGTCNFTVVEIIPKDSPVTLHWRVFNTSGNKSNSPFEILKITSGEESYEITNRNVGNDALNINGVIVKFNSETEHIRVEFGNSFRVAPGADYLKSIRYSNWIYTGNPIP